MNKKNVAQKNDESLLEQAFRIESIYKKHKIKLWILLGLIIIAIIGWLIYGAMQQAKLEKANEAYLTLQEDANNSEALGVLESSNPKLFEAYRFQQAVKNDDVEVLKSLSASQNDILADLSQYTVSVLEKEPTDSMIFGDLANLQNAYLLIQKKEFDRAKEILELIPEGSGLYEQALQLKHFTIKGQ